MSDLLVHWAVYDDCRRLTAGDERMEPLLVRLMEEHADFARLGAISRAGGTFVPAILTRAREAWSDGDDRLAKKVAYALGGIAHYPADFHMKPLQRRLSAEAGKPDVREVSAYYDCHVFREVYMAGDAEPFNRFLLQANDTEPGRALEAFVRSLFQRALLSSHTLAPDKKDLDGWLDNLISRVQPLYIDVELYVRVFTAPDPERAAFYGVETAFYRRDDPAVAAARRVQRGESVAQAALDAAVAEGANAGEYGKAVALGVRALREASAFWRGEAAEPPDVSQG